MARAETVIETEWEVVEGSHGRERSPYLAICRGQRCYLRVPGVCTASGCDDGTVVPAHSNQSRHGKGAGIKANHRFTVPGCFSCHAWIDQGPAPRQTKFNFWDMAFFEWEPIREKLMGKA
jgi:hypothetical protein